MKVAKSEIFNQKFEKKQKFGKIQFLVENEIYRPKFGENKFLAKNVKKICFTFFII